VKTVFLESLNIDNRYSGFGQYPRTGVYRMGAEI